MALVPQAGRRRSRSLDGRNRQQRPRRTMKGYTPDCDIAKGWFAGSWDSDLAISVGYANTGVDEPHFHKSITKLYLVALGSAAIRVDGKVIVLQERSVTRRTRRGPHVRGFFTRLLPLRDSDARLAGRRVGGRQGRSVIRWPERLMRTMLTQAQLTRDLQHVRGQTEKGDDRRMTRSMAVLVPNSSKSTNT